MRKIGLLSSSAISSAALFGLSVAFAAPAYAQDSQEQGDCTAEQTAAGTCDTEQELDSAAPVEAQQEQHEHDEPVADTDEEPGARTDTETEAEHDTDADAEERQHASR